MNTELIVSARVIAFSPSFKGKDGSTVSYPKLTVRIGQQIVEIPVRGVENEVCEKSLDKDVTLTCEVFPAKTKAASLRAVGLVKG